MRLPISQHSLWRCRLELEDGTLERASLFPLFDDTGRTRRFMITAEDSWRIMLVDWSRDLFRRERLRRNRLRHRYADLSDASASEAQRIDDLWHFDPWWVLTEPRYAGHEAVPTLRATNIPGYDSTLSRIWFDGTLARVTHVAIG